MDSDELTFSVKERSIISFDVTTIAGKMYVEVAQMFLDPSGQGHLLTVPSWKTALGQQAPLGASPERVKTREKAEQT